MKKTKTIVLLSVLLAMAVAISAFDRYITGLAFPYFPTAKLGLANIVILTILITYSFKETLIVVVLKSFLLSFVFGITALIIGGSASLVSFLGMYFVFHFFRKKISYVGISVIGGFLHIVTQLFVTWLVYQLGDVVMYYGAILIFVSLITSVLVGVIVTKLNQYFIKIIE